MKPADYSIAERDVCPVCDRQMAVTKAGKMRRHGNPDKTLWPPQDCAGSGQYPKGG